MRSFNTWMMRSIRQYSMLTLMFCLTCLLGASPAGAQLRNLAQAPLFLTTSVPPNVFIELDDSGSMDWEILTIKHWQGCNYWTSSCSMGEITNGQWTSESSNGSQESFEYMFDTTDHAYSGGCTSDRERVERCGTTPTNYDWRIRSSDFNVLYYNPRIKYRPWPGTGLTDASFSAARSNPQSGTGGYSNTRNLANFIYEVWNDNKGYSESQPKGSWRLNMTNGANGEVDLWDSHARITVGSSIKIETISYPATSSGLSNPSITTQTLTSLPVSYCSPACSSGRTLAEEKQNIANWYQYARRRSFVAKGAIAEVVKQNPKYRYGLSVINEYTDLMKRVPAANVTDFTQHNQDLLSSLFNFRWPALGTPLRNALKRTGEYFKETTNAPIINECQQNFALLMTDGYWNGSNPNVSDRDYDGISNTLADVARKFYIEDLRPDLANYVPTNTFDTVNHQHMVTFTAAFGVQGELQDSNHDGWPDVQNVNLKENGNWGNPTSCSDCPQQIDDLWHAAYNSRGQFVSARTPQELVDGLQATLATIANRLSSASAVATTASVLRTDTKVFQARFDSTDWSGQLRALAVNGDGSIAPAPVWDTKASGSLFNQQNWNTDRRIITYKPSQKQGIAFRWPANPNSPNATELDSTQIAALNDNPHTLQLDNDAQGVKRLEYLRGDRREEEKDSLGYRKRSNVLGDLVNSKPLYVGAPFLRYREDLEIASYQAFKQTYKNRKSIVYIGGNDGMLHGFNADAGNEEIAFVPNQVFKHLNKLTAADYTHRFFVDGPLTASDVFLNNRGPQGKWRTVLIGGLAAGGQGLYALDITDPELFKNESNANKIVLWEFSDANDSDLGYTYGRPTVAKTAAGPWGVIFGNGYNNSESDAYSSTTGHAVLYILNVETGQILRKIDTGVGTVAAPNALAAPEVIDVNSDTIMDYIYAGDYYGNLWAFDVRDSNPANWHIAYNKPLFTAPAGQPITVRPLVERHSEYSHGYLVHFGTGSYVYSNDHSSANQATQSVYAVWDKHQPIWDKQRQTWVVWDKTKGDDGEWVEAKPDETEKVTLSSSITRSQLLSQSIIGETSDGWREISDTSIEWLLDKASGVTGRHLGWYLDLTFNNNNKGERVITDFALRNQRVIFNTILPSTNTCASAGSSWLMILNATNGGRLKKVVEEKGNVVVKDSSGFDTDGDGELTLADSAAAGRLQNDLEFGPGLIVEQPGIGDTYIPELGYAITNTSGGELDSTEINLGREGLGRQTWQQLID